MEPRPMMDRLEAVFSIVPKAHAIADIGTRSEEHTSESSHRYQSRMPSSA